MKKTLLLFIVILSNSFANAQTDINSFFGDWLRDDGTLLQITSLANNEGGTKARYNHGTTHMYNAQFPTPNQYNYVVTWDSSNSELNFSYINIFVDYLNLTTFNNYTYTVTSFTNQQMILLFENGTTVTYQRQTLGTPNFTSDLQNTKIFKNPVQNNLAFNLPQSLQQVKVQIFSIEGKEMVNTVYERNDTVDVSFLSPGMYFIELSENNGARKNIKMIKD
jgi:hypothetical protein